MPCAAFLALLAQSTPFVLDPAALPGVRTTCGARDKRFIVEVDGGGLALADFDGDLEDYRKMRLKTEKTKRDDGPKTTRKDERRADAEARNSSREAVRTQLKPLEKQLATIESRVAKLGKEAEAARNALADPGIYDDAQRDRLKQLMAADARLKADLAQAEDDWLHISAKIEALKAEETVS